VNAVPYSCAVGVLASSKSHGRVLGASLVRALGVWN